MFRIQEYLVHLEKNAKHQVGATATEFAVISAKKTLTRVLKLEEPYNYYGIKQINKVFVSETINTTFDGHDDRNIKTIYDTLMRRNEKFCILHTTSKLKIVHANIMTKLRSMYSNMTIFTYNGNGSFLMCDNEYDIDNLFKWCKGSQIKRKIDSRGKYLYISKSIKLGDIMSEIQVNTINEYTGASGVTIDGLLIKDGAIINTSASIDHDCVIGDFAHISPNATLCGHVSVGKLSQIGAGSVIIQGVKIGKNVTVGAGSVIINDIPDNSVVVGNPGKIIKAI